MNHETIHDHGITECNGLHWAVLQGVDIVFDRHSKGQNLLAIDGDNYVLARVALTWKEYFTFSAQELTEVIKRLVFDAKAVQQLRASGVDLFA